MWQVKVKKIHEEAQLPTKGSEDAACWDIYAIGDHMIGYNTNAHTIHTGLIVEVPKGFFLDIRPRSGKSIEGLMICNTPGTIDCDYRGEVIIIMRAFPGIHIHINKGDKIAQIRLERENKFEWLEVDEITTTRRGSKGFGSSGQ